ncbi:AAA family ATPase [Pseudooceanicola nanhaiensis]|uniref:AAA family ATPase n=1 Tax=Pseudooceanicola nanhaiensis TaxID=375761 RepID=UPI003514C0D7
MQTGYLNGQGPATPASAPSGAEALSPAEPANPFRVFWDSGFTRLVPIAPPDAQVAEGSNLHADNLGKAPGERGADGTWRGLKGWSKHDATEGDLDRWAGMGAGVGVKLGAGLISVDIDTRDPVAAERVLSLAQETLGPAPVRFGNKPKALLIYRTAEDIKHPAVTFDSALNENAQVEFQSEGKQVVVHGIHPVTGQPYAWPNGLPRREELPEIDRAKLDAFAGRLLAELPGARTGRAAERKEGETDPATLLADPDPERAAEIVGRIMRDMPNSGEAFRSRDAFRETAHAIRGAVGDDTLAFEIFDEWARRWDEGVNTTETDFEFWESIGSSRELGIRRLQDLAILYGVGSVFFDDETAAEIPDPPEASPEQPTRRLKLLGVRDIKNRKPPEFLVDGLIPEKGLGVLYGAPASKKSFLVTDAGMSIAYDLPDWHGRKIKPGEGAVIYIAGEGESGYTLRLDAWERGRLPFGPGEGQRPFFLVQGSVDFMDAKHLEELVACIRADWGGPVRMVVVDTISQATPGADENSQADMTRFLTNCKGLQRAFDCFVMGIHHTGKDGKRMRGSTVFTGNVDVVLRVEAKGKHPEGLVTLTAEKIKDSEDGWHDTFQMRRVEWTRDGKTLSSLVPSKPDHALQSAEEKRRRENWGAVFLEVLRNEPEGADVKWAGIAAEVAGVAKAKGLCGTTDRAAVLAIFRDFLVDPGVDVLSDTGVKMNISMQNKEGRTGWVVRKQRVPDAISARAMFAEISKDFAEDLSELFQ